MHCDPACWGCTAAGTCPMELGQVPAVAVPPKRWTPDRLAGRRAGCGHIIDILPLVRDIFSIKEVWCYDCNCWVKPPPKNTTTTTKRRHQPPDGQEELIPF